MNSREPTSPLLQAAEALEGELRALEALVAKAQKEPLTSQKNFERAARTLGGVNELEERLRGALSRMVEAIGEAGQRQQGALQALALRAQELEARFASYRELLALRDGLNTDGAKVNDTIRGLLTSGGLGAAVPEALAELARVGETARRLFAQAKERDFHDLAREADSVQQQLQAMHRKLARLSEAGARLDGANGGQPQAEPPFMSG
jgi:hypothetical protein